jgi:hypothetical protein
MKAVKSLSRSTGVSMAEVIRQCIDAGIPHIKSNRKRQYLQASKLIGIGRDRESKKTISRDHDAHAWESI